MLSYALSQLLSDVIVAAGLDKHFAFSSNAAGGQSTALGMMGLPGNPVGYNCSKRHAKNICVKFICNYMPLSCSLSLLITMLPANLTAAWLAEAAMTSAVWDLCVSC